MRRRTTAWVLACTGCSFPHRDLPTAEMDAVVDTAPPDARVDAPPGAVCYGSMEAFVVECFDPGALPSGAFVVPATFDTGMDANCTRVVLQSGGPNLCVVAAGTITVSSYARVTGPRAAVFLASDSITINNVLDASSFVASSAGPAANTGSCSGPGNGTDDTGNGTTAGGGGGGGGALGSAGGRGGSGSSGSSAAGAGGGKITAGKVRGGCRGGHGGKSSGGAGGVGGAGGGALYLLAKNTITISGSVRANGAAGRGGAKKAGGGGGGSGGMIVLDSPTIVVTGNIFANGAGGGEGGDTGAAGDVGSEPGTWDQAAPGGSGNASKGGNGGAGSVGSGAGGLANGGGNGGGGGGGGAGIIRVYSSGAPTGKISPPAS